MATLLGPLSLLRASSVYLLNRRLSFYSPSLVCEINSSTPWDKNIAIPLQGTAVSITLLTVPCPQDSFFDSCLTNTGQSNKKLPKKLKKKKKKETKLNIELTPRKQLMLEENNELYISKINVHSPPQIWETVQKHDASIKSSMTASFHHYLVWGEITPAERGWQCPARSGN